MARSLITAQSAGRAQSLTVTVVPGDAVNGNKVAWDPRLEIFILNDDGANPHTPTIVSVADNLGREGDIADAIDASGGKAYPSLPAEGFKQLDGMVYIDIDDANLMIIAWLKDPNP